MDSDYDQQFDEEEDYYYDSDGYTAHDESAESDDEDEDIILSAVNSQPLRQPYSVLTEHDIQKRQEDAIASVSSVLSIPSSEASILLRNSEWSVSRVNEEWFNDEARVRERIGLLINNNANAESEVKKLQTELPIGCRICLEYIDYEKEMMATSDFCGHQFCKGCWAGYAEAAIADGAGCLSLRCPAPRCKAAVRTEDLIFPLISEEHRAKYGRYLMRSYVESNTKVKWCPAPGCEFAIECENVSEVQDVVCRCGHSFCWKCCEEHHRPVACDMVARWMQKNRAESENVTWMLANSKPCPKCRRPIEKNDGCMHMTCTPPCKFEFCWLCLGDWTEHGHSTGGFYACNRYEAEKTQGKYKEEERTRQMAKRALKKYTHYYERWASNHKSKEKALQDLHNLQECSMEMISDKLSLSNLELKFVYDAWLQIVECRRVLKWTYAYGYYLCPHLDDKDIVAKKNFFEYLQGQAESALERLHECAEKDIEPFIGDTQDYEFFGPPPPLTQLTINKETQDVENVEKELHLIKDLQSKFAQFRTKLIDLTSVTRTFFANLVQALENNLADVEYSSPLGSTLRLIEEEEEEYNEYWLCNHCTFANPVSSSSSRVCSICRLSN